MLTTASPTICLVFCIPTDLYIYWESCMAYINQQPTSHPETVLGKLENVTPASKWHGHSKLHGHAGGIILSSVLALLFATK